MTFAYLSTRQSRRAIEPAQCKFSSGDRQQSFSPAASRITCRIPDTSCGRSAQEGILNPILLLVVDAMMLYLGLMLSCQHHICGGDVAGGLGWSTACKGPAHPYEAGGSVRARTGYKQSRSQKCVRSNTGANRVNGSSIGRFRGEIFLGCSLSTATPWPMLFQRRLMIVR
eukprot:scaffold7759_cov471-Prasinococcus_capsulatus_cf.AAC.2